MLDILNNYPKFLRPLLVFLALMATMLVVFFVTIIVIVTATHLMHETLLWLGAPDGAAAAGGFGFFILMIIGLVFSGGFILVNFSKDFGWN